MRGGRIVTVDVPQGEQLRMTHVDYSREDQVGGDLGYSNHPGKKREGSHYMIQS